MWTTSASLTEPLRSSKGDFNSALNHTGTYRFAIEVGGDDEKQGRREDFEWRHGGGEDIQHLGVSGRGWRLVRLGASAAANGDGGAQGGDWSSVGATGDAGEIVAFWARSSSVFVKGYKFDFLGAGLTGEMGERWAIMAVMTALRVWYIEAEPVAIVVAVT
jgi:hypothetical protein